jgi:glycosyltransferase involved in cell wall biosynthesis
MIDVITPTIRHEGIKIVARCLERQTLQDFRWIVVDHDYDLNWYYENIPKSLWGKTIYLRPKVQNPVRKYKLWNTRNTAYPFLENPLVVEIQDYHWFKSDTLKRFWDIYEEEPTALVSAYYSIVTFKNYELAMELNTLTDQDVEIIDPTVRVIARNKNLVENHTPYLAYEMNVSSIPLDVFKKYIPVDEEMDNGYLVDTHYISIQAQRDKHKIYIGGNFTVYSFEHKLREPRPQGWMKDSQINQRYLHERFGQFMEGNE